MGYPKGGGKRGGQKYRMKRRKWGGLIGCERGIYREEWRIGRVKQAASVRIRGEKGEDSIGKREMDFAGSAQRKGVRT